MNNQETEIVELRKRCSTLESKRDQLIADLLENIRKVEKMGKIIAFAYQIAGVHDCPERILDVLSDPEYATDAQVEAMLPYQPFSDSDLFRSIEGLGRMTNEDDGYITLQFKDEDSAQRFMNEYIPTVDVRDMPAMREDMQSPATLSDEQIDDMAFGYAPSGKIGELREFSLALLAASGSSQGNDSKDAARYRWLRDQDIMQYVGSFAPYVVQGQTMRVLEGREIDAAIDSAMKVHK